MGGGGGEKYGGERLNTEGSGLNHRELECHASKLRFYFKAHRGPGNIFKHGSRVARFSK